MLSNEQIIEKLMYESRELIVHLCDGYTNVIDSSFDTALSMIIGDNLREIKQLRLIKSRN